MKSAQLLRSAAFVAAAFVAAALVAGSQVASAQAGGEAADRPAESRLTRPELLRFVPAERPPGTDELGEVGVILELTIATDGHVQEARVVESAGELFDPVALTAARQFEFRPATLDGEPVAARIHFRYVFEAPVPAPAPAPVPVPAPAPVAPVPAATPQPEPEEEVEFSASATVDRPPREVTRRTLSQDELLSVAGTRGDPLRAIEILPGVARPAFGSGDLIIRGSSPDDSQVFLDGTPVPLLYHFGGLTSFMNGQLIEQIDFYPGNYAVRNGRFIGGIVEVAARDVQPEDFRGVLDVNLIDGSIYGEAPLTDRIAMAVAFRRSTIDTWFGAVMSGADDVSLVAAPVYYDYQLMFVARPSSRDTVRLLTYGSNDRLELLFDEPSDTDPSFRGGLSNATRFNHVDLAWERRLEGGAEQELRLAFAPSRVAFDFGPDVHMDFRTYGIIGRAEWRKPFGDHFTLTAGLDLQFLPFDVTYRGPFPEQEEGQPVFDPIATQDGVDISVVATAYRPAAYVEAAIDMDPVRLVLGLRADYYSDLEALSIDPRAVAIFAVADGTRLKAGVGLFSQAPQLNESSPQIGNPALDPIRALHLSAGVEQDLAPGIEVGLEGFYKSLWDRAVSTQGSVAPFFESVGTGRIHGLEVSARVEPRAFDGRFFGFFSYTLSRSERLDGPGETWRAFDHDQTHIMNASATWRLPRGWQLGTTFRLSSGSPTTELVAGVYDIDSDTYRAVPGAVNAQREELFHRIDLRVEKTWTFDADGRLTFYLDVQNLYNNRSQEAEGYNYDFSESEPVLGLPIIPSLGLRGEI